MSAGRAEFVAPGEEYERRVGMWRYRASRQVSCLAALWLAVQVVAVCEFATSLVVLWRLELDTLVTIGMMWAVSVPVAGGAAVFALGSWTVLPRRRIVLGLIPWAVIVAELTAAIVVIRL